MEEATAPLPWTVPVGVEADNLETLSLTLARRLCQRQGGDLVGFCSPRDGYHITLLLPLSQNGEGADAPAAAPRQERLVLLVSADGEQVGQAQDGLGDRGTRLVLATRWGEALDLAQHLTPDLVLLDQSSLADLPPNPLTILAQMVPRPGDLVMINRAESLTLALASLSGTPHRVMAPAHPQPFVDVPTLLILTYRGRSVPTSAPMDGDTSWRTALQRQRCRLVQADDLVQARLLCRVWEPQAILLAEDRGFTSEDWGWVAQCPELMQRPWLALSAWTSPIPQGLVVLDGSGLVAQPPSLDLVGLIQIIQTAQR